MKTYVSENGKIYKETDSIYCRYCDKFVEVSKLFYWAGDDRPQLCCPGCDTTLIMLQKRCICGQPVAPGADFCQDCLDSKYEEWLDTLEEEDTE